MYLWSDPNPSNQTSADLSSRFQVQGQNIAGVLAAILHQREIQQQLAQQQQQYQQSQLQSGLQNYYKQQQSDQTSGELADYMNAERQAQIAGVPGSESELMQEQYQNMSPQARAAAMQWQNQQEQQALMNQYRQAQINHLNATGGSTQPNIYTAPDGSQYIVSPNGGVHPLGAGAGQQGGGDYSYLNPSNVTFDAKNPDMTYVNGQPMTDSAYKTLVQGALRTKAGRAAYEAYIQGNGPAPQAPPGTATGSAGVRQSDIDQAKQAMGNEQSAATATNPPAATGIAPSRDEAPIGGYYRAPDGSIRIRQN